MFRLALSTLALLAVAAAPVATAQAQGSSDGSTVTVAGNKQWCC
ncbi:MAG TPA: hypothetical protein VFV40_06455 [Nocardioides sp.]|nr:hypothetical protein [Nocardioides sp.]